MAQSVGYAMLPVSVSIKGINGQLNKQIVGPAQNAAKKASDSVRKQLATGADAAAKAVESARNKEQAATNKVVEAEKKLKSARDTAETKAKSVESAELKLQAARSTEKSKVADAEKKLADLRNSGKASAEQIESAERNLEAVRATQGAKVLDAENRLQSARNASEGATDKAKQAEDNLTTAKSRAASASDEVISATKELDAANDGLSGSTAGAEGAFGRLKSKLSEMKSELFGTKTDMESVDSGASEMGYSFDDVSSKGGNLSGSLFDVGKKAGAAALAFAGVSGIGNTIQAGFDKVNKIEDTTAALEVMMGSATDATRVMDQLEESNQNTPYAFDAWSEAGKNLIAFGVDADKTSGIVTALGEAAASTGKGDEALSSMGRAFGQAAASGKISMETINTLADGGVQGLAILANEAGVSTEEMQKMISSGAVPAGEAIDTLTKGIMEGTEGAAGSTSAMAGTMEKMSETTSGRIENMKSAFNNMAGSIMGAVAPAIAVAAEKITEFVYALKGWVDGLINGEGAMGAVKKAIDVMMPVLKPLAFIIGSAAAALTAMKLASLAYQGAALLAGKATQALSMAMGALMKHPIVAAISAIVGGLIYFFTQTETGKRVWDELMEKLKVVGAWISDTFGPIFQNLGEIISVAWDGIKVAFEAGWAAIQPIFSLMGAVFSTVWDGLQLAWTAIGQPILDLIVGAFGLWWQGVKMYFDFLKNLFTTVWDGLQIAWSAVGQPVLNVIIGAFNIMKDALHIAFNLVRASFQVLWEAVKRAWDAIGAPIVGFIIARFQVWWSGMQRIFGWVRSGWDALWGAVRAGWDAVGRPVVDTVVSVFGWFRDKIKAAFDIVSGFAADLWNDISNFFGKIFNKIGEVKDKVLQPFKDAGSWLVDAGKNIIDGLLNGIGDLGKKISKWFLDKIPGWIKEPFKKALDIHSPSKVFAGFGQNIGQGLIDGIDGMGRKVEKSAQGMADRVADVDMPDISANVDSDALTADVSAKVDVSSVAPEAGAGVESASAGAEAMQQSADTMQTAAQGQLDPMWQQQDALITGFGQTMTDTATGVVTPVFDQMAAGLQAAKTSVIDPVFAGVQSGLGAVGNQFTAQTQAVIGPMWNSMGANLQNVKATVVDPAFAGVQLGLQNVGNKFISSVNSVMNPVWSSMGNHIRAIQTGTISPAFGTVETGLSHLSGWFSTTVGNIGTAWDRMRAATGRPAKFVVQTVFNDGIKRAWDSISDMIDEKPMKPVPLGGLGAYAQGGVLPGYTPGRDVHRFDSPTGGSLMLSGGESVMRPEWTQAVGGPSAVDAMNKAAKSGGKRGVGKMLGEGAQFADGGVIDKKIAKTKRDLMKENGKGYQWGGVGNPSWDCSGLWSGIVHSLNGGNMRDGRLFNTTSLMANPGGFGFKKGLNGRVTVGVNGGHMAGTIDGKNAESASNPKGVQFGGSAWGSDHSSFTHHYTLADFLGRFISGGMGGGATVSMTELVKDAWDAEIKKIPKFQGGKGKFGKVPGQWQKKAVARTWKYVKKQADKMMAGPAVPGGSGVDRWRPMVKRAFPFQNEPFTTDHFERLMQQMKNESNGDPGVMQHGYVDVNTGGNEAVGLFQFAKSTWPAYRDPRLKDDRRDPWANINAAVRYARDKHHWGPIVGSPGGWKDGGVLPANLFDTGGVLKPDTMAVNKSGKPEPVLNNQQWTDVSGLVDQISKLVPAVKRFAPQIQQFVDDNPDVQKAIEIGNQAQSEFFEKHPDPAAEVRQGVSDDVLDFFGAGGSWFTDLSKLDVSWETPDPEGTGENATKKHEVTNADAGKSMNITIENITAMDTDKAARDVAREARRVLAAF